jgi:hypothetical protein
MNVIMKGFRQDNGLRSYDFEVVGVDRSRREITVGADLALLRKYAISMQELPLICRLLLEGEPQSEAPEKLAFTFTEALMREHANKRIALTEARKRKAPHKRPHSEQLGQAWRRPGI